MPPEKGAASSRLLSMKFMQRAAASANDSTPSTPEGPPSKRMRLSNGTSTPATPSSDLQKVQAAQAEEELRRSAVIERLAAEAGETRWVLNVREPERTETGFVIIETGFADIDELPKIAPSKTANGLDESEESSSVQTVAGRMVFGKKPQPARNKTSDRPSDSESDSESDSNDSTSDEEDDPTAALIRESRKQAAEQARADRRAKKQAAAAELQRLAAQRRSKSVNLNSRGGLHSPLIECWYCKEIGHRSKDCLKPRKDPR